MFVGKFLNGIVINSLHPVTSGVLAAARLITQGMKHRLGTQSDNNDQLISVAFGKSTYLPKKAETVTMCWPAGHASTT